MKTNVGEEISCKAREFDFDHSGVIKRRGVISYYATKTMTQATTVNSWLRLIQESSQEDLTKGLITPVLH